MQDDKALASDEYQESTLVARKKIQDILGQLRNELGGGGDPEAIDALLRRRLDEAGLPEQPAPWMRMAVDELADGRVTVLDPQDQLPDDELEKLDRTPGERKSPHIF
jgi:hypothetical protein